MDAQIMNNVTLDLSKMVYFEEGTNTMFVSKSHAFHAIVRSYLHMMKEKGFKAEIEQVSMEVIEEKRLLSKKTQAFLSEASSMQLMATALFAKAVKRRASDIHIRVSFKGKTQIFFRIHNNLELIEEHVASFGKLLCSAIYMAMCDISDATYEELDRQDARISSADKLSEGLDGIRVATTPQVDGSVMVLRLLYNDADKSTDLCALGFTETQRDQVGTMKRKPTGINIIGGPTGSGKSTTLQRTLLSIHEEAGGTKHIITVEDPPEYPMPGIVQTPVANAGTEEERAIAFQAAIKATMRLDPNVIMIGEMRDTPSVRLAIQAAMTGHQVWSTVHANGAFAIIDRMMDLGISLNIMSDASIVTGLVCQRLLKVLCSHCKQPLPQALSRYTPADQARILGSVDLNSAFVAGDGCPHCQDTGIAGRTVVAEVVIPDEKLMAFIRRGEKHLAIDYWRSTGGSNMLEQAIKKINAGLIDPFQAEEEVGSLTVLVESSDSYQGGN